MSNSRQYDIQINGTGPYQQQLEPQDLGGKVRSIYFGVPVYGNAYGATDASGKFTVKGAVAAAGGELKIARMPPGKYRFLDVIAYGSGNDPDTSPALAHDGYETLTSRVIAAGNIDRGDLIESSIEFDLVLEGSGFSEGYVTYVRD